MDFDELEQKLKKAEDDCRASFDHLRAISKHETPQVKTKYVVLQRTSDLLIVTHLLKKNESLSEKKNFFRIDLKVHGRISHVTYVYQYTCFIS